VAGGALRDPGAADRLLDCALHRGLVKRVAPALAGLALDVDARGREDPLPRPLATGAWVLPGQCPRQLDPGRTMLEIALVLPLHGLEVCGELGRHDGGQRGGPILVALPARTVIWLRAKSASCTRRRTASRRWSPDPYNRMAMRRWVPRSWRMTARTSSRVSTTGRRTVRSAHDVVEPREVLFQHLAVEEEQRAQGLVLGGGGDLAVDGQRGQELRYVGSAHLERVALAVKKDVPAGPRDVGLSLRRL
jgi:hypothetical protein